MNRTGAIATLALIGFGVFGATAVQAKPPLRNSAPTIRVLDAFGKCESKPVGRAPYMPLAIGDAFASETMVRTGANAAMLLRLPGGQNIRVGAQSVVFIVSSTNGKLCSAKVLSGQVWVQIPAAQRSARLVVTTPSAGVDAPAGTLFAVSYELESNQSIVSNNGSNIEVWLLSGSWKAILRRGEFVPYLRSPQPNIRLRAPVIKRHNDEQKEMWRLIAAEPWMQGKSTLNRKNEAKLREDLHAVEIKPETR